MSDKLKVNIYVALPMILEKVKMVALSKFIGKTDAWTLNKLRHAVVKGVPQEFYETDLPLVNNALHQLGEAIAGSVVTYVSDREQVIASVRSVDAYVSMPYIYLDILKQKRLWFANRMRERKPGGKASSFKEEDIQKINMGIMQIANELRNIELIL